MVKWQKGDKESAGSQCIIKQYKKNTEQGYGVFAFKTLFKIIFLIPVGYYFALLSKNVK